MSFVCSKKLQSKEMRKHAHLELDNAVKEFKRAHTVYRLASSALSDSLVAAGLSIQSM